MSSDLPSSSTMVVDVVSDVVCPWCFIGKRRLEKALAMRPDVVVAVRWRPYLLNPWVPRGGIDRKTYLETKFGSVDRYAAIAERIAVAAQEEGLHFAFDKIARQPSTIDCHRLILWARNASSADRMKQRLMELYFCEGADLTEAHVLVEAAQQCGLDGDLVRKLLASEADADKIVREASAAREAGIDGVPCFIFGNVLAVAGAQHPHYLADALGRAAEQYAARTAQGAHSSL